MKKGLSALQDDCWDQICPYTQQGGSTGKLDCFQANADKICECCKTRGLSDCKVLIPNRGLVDACSINSGGSGNKKLTDTEIEFIKNKLAAAILGDNNDIPNDSLARIVNCMYPEMEKIMDMRKLIKGDTFDETVLTDEEKNKVKGITEICANNVLAAVNLIGGVKPSGITRNIPKNVLIGIVAAFVLLIVLSVFFSMKK